MTEAKDLLQPDELWQSLSDRERIICVQFAVADWKIGVGEDYVDAMGIKGEDLDKLVERGVIEIKPTWQLYQDLANQLRGRAEVINSLLQENPFLELKDEDRKILRDYDRYQSVTGRKNPEPRYHLSSLEFHNYICTLGRE
jgi:hypothetical protein